MHAEQEERSPTCAPQPLMPRNLHRTDTLGEELASLDVRALQLDGQEEGFAWRKQEGVRNPHAAPAARLDAAGPGGEAGQEPAAEGEFCRHCHLSEKSSKSKIFSDSVSMPCAFRKKDI